MSKHQNNLFVGEKFKNKKLKIVSATTLATFLAVSPLTPLVASADGQEDMERALSGSPKVKASHKKTKAKAKVTAGSSVAEPNSHIHFHTIQVPSQELLTMLYKRSQEEPSSGQGELVTDLVKATTEANANALKARMLAATLGMSPV